MVGLQLILIYIHFILNCKTKKETFMPFYTKPDTSIMLHIFPFLKKFRFGSLDQMTLLFQAGKRLLLMFNRIKWLAELGRCMGQFRLRPAMIENDTKISEAHENSHLFLFILCVRNEPALALLLTIFSLRLDQSSSTHLGKS